MCKGQQVIIPGPRFTLQKVSGKALPGTVLVFRECMVLEVAGPHTLASMCAHPSRMPMQSIHREQLTFVCVYLGNDWI